LVAGIDKTGPKLYAIEPSGVYYGYRATASGKGKALAKTELEKVIAKEGGITVKEGVMELARMWVTPSSTWQALMDSIHLVHDDNKDKDFELEMTWVCAESGNKHKAVPAELLAEADAKGKAALEEGMEED
jgi:20S proteasome subunit alpha 7